MLVRLRAVRPSPYARAFDVGAPSARAANSCSRFLQVWRSYGARILNGFTELPCGSATSSA
jgi:hypothetical protein